MQANDGFEVKVTKAADFCAFVCAVEASAVGRVSHNFIAESEGAEGFCDVGRKGDNSLRNLLGLG